MALLGPAQMEDVRPRPGDVSGLAMTGDEAAATYSSPPPEGDDVPSKHDLCDAEDDSSIIRQQPTNECILLFFCRVVRVQPSVECIMLRPSYRPLLCDKSEEGKEEWSVICG